MDANVGIRPIANFPKTSDLTLQDRPPERKRYGGFLLARAVVIRAHPEKCETVFGLDARQNKQLRRADLIQSDRDTL